MIYRKIRGYLCSLKCKFYYYDLIFSGAKVAKNVSIFGDFTYYYAENITIGSNSTINKGVILNARDKITIGRGVRLSNYVQLHTGGLNLESKSKNTHIQDAIVIEDNVWIASGAIITMGCRIGKNSVVAANSVVTKDVEENSFVAGVPAKFKKKLFNSEDLCGNI